MLQISSIGMPERAVILAGEETVARADGSLFWPRGKTLFVADLHLGKAATFRSLAVPVPVGTTQAGLHRLSEALATTGACKLVFLGDMWHAKEGRTDPILNSVAEWRRKHVSVHMTLVEGNHDRRSGKLPPQLGIEEVAEGHALGPFTAFHYPAQVDDTYVLCGHIHPAVKLEGLGDQAIRLPCFWFGERTAVLPSFGDFTGFGDVRPRAGDQVLVIAEGQLYEVGTPRSKTGV